jgi:hypothetical protein
MNAAPAVPAMVRVTVADAWKVFALDVTPAENAASLKARALASAHIDPSGGGAARYEVKVGGALVKDESKPLAGLGLKTGSSVVVLASRRRPVR